MTADRGDEIRLSGSLTVELPWHNRLPLLCAWGCDFSTARMPDHEQHLYERVSDTGAGSELSPEGRTVIYRAVPVVCPICGHLYTDVATLHEGWCEGHGPCARSLDPIGAR